MLPELPVEVQLAYEVSSCQAVHVAQQPVSRPSPCGYFRSWGTYHSFDYLPGRPELPDANGRIAVRYVGRAPLVPEILTGCRKAPLMAVGINPNLPGWWPWHRSALNPLFRHVRDYAHYFRYRGAAKLQLDPATYANCGGSDADTPLSTFELDVPADATGRRVLSAEAVPQAMYLAYQHLLDSLGTALGAPQGTLTVGEDLAYGNMIASPSGKWSTLSDGTFPAMTPEQRNGIVAECFRRERYFVRQLFQSLPAVVLVFSQSTANAFIGEFQHRFTLGDPQLREPVADLLARELRFGYGTASAATLDARVIFAPHPTGDPEEYQAAVGQVIAQIVEECQRGALAYNSASGHLFRTHGACAFCPMLGVGPCDYPSEVEPGPGDVDPNGPLIQGRRQLALPAPDELAPSAIPVSEAWAGTDF